MEKKEIERNYQKLIDKYTDCQTRLKRNQFVISMARLVLFVTALAASFPAFSNSVLSGIVLLLFSVIVFLLLVIYSNVLSEKILFINNLILINESELNALKGNYSSFNGGNDWKSSDHDFSNDTDLFGDDSLFSYLNRTVTGYGREKLAGWLSIPYSFRSTIIDRQEAVRELSDKITWRQEFMANGLGKPLEKGDIESLRKWLTENDIILSSLVLKSLVIVSPMLTIAILILALAKLVPFTFFGLFFIINLMLIAGYLKKTNKVHSMVSRKYNFLSSFEKLIISFKSEQFRSKVLSDAFEKLIPGNKSAASKIRNLAKIIQAFDSRMNVFIGLLLNGLILWDFQCIKRLEKWKQETADLLPVWLEVIGEVDALLSLANHAFNNPLYIFPGITEGDPFISAINLGHPLINEKTRICNDFTLEDKGSICIVTGANMAGKSTFLRTVAVNMILGMAGTTVCAEKFEFKPCILYTSMRTTDSLSHNESYFYAELKRLKILKERLESGENIFFILDEILKGTNSADKSTGSKMFLARLAESGARGIIATHDISLGEMEKEFPEKVFNKCFEVEIEGESVLFDYKLRDGITRHMNASILMRQMGII